MKGNTYAKAVAEGSDVVIQFIIAVCILAVLLVTFGILLALWVPEWTANVLTGGWTEPRRATARVLALVLVAWLRVTIVQGCVP